MDNSSALSGKFHRIVKQIPKDLLNADRIGPDMVFLGVQFHREFQRFAGNVRLSHVERFPKHGMGVDALELKLDFARVTRVKSSRSSISRACNCTFR